MSDLPDVLVLGAGGALAERWMHGVLAGLEHAAGVDARAIERLVGTSAGAIVAADLLAGRAPQPPAAAARLAAEAERAPAPAPDEAAATEPAADGADEADPDEDADAAAADEPRAGGAGVRGLLGAVPRGVGRAARAAGGPLAPVALAAARPAAARVRAGVLGRIEPARASLDELGRRLAADGLRFDGRLRVVAVERESGRRVVFGGPGAPRATVAEAVQASCSVPWLYRPVRIGEREYVDGGLWSPTSIDVAPAGRETRVLCLNPTGGGSREGAPALAAGIVRAGSRSAAALEAAALRRRGAEVTVVEPDAAAAAALAGGWGGDAHADPARSALEAGFRQGVVLARRD